MMSLPSANSATALSSVARTSPTLPPSPSSASAITFGLDRRHHLQRLHGLGHIMYAHDIGAGHDRQQIARDRTADALMRLGGRNRRNEALARQSHQDRQSELAQLAEPRDHRGALIERFAKADTGVEHDALAPDAGSAC